MTQAYRSQAELTVGDLIELEVTDIAHGGVCVARHEAKVVFVADAIPGERVQAQVTEAHKRSFARATTVAVLQPSEDRCPHIWPEAAVDRAPAWRVGGAEFGHILPARQRALKTQVIMAAMRRFAGIDQLEASELAQSTDGRVVTPIGNDLETGGRNWRTRVRLHVDAASGQIGPYAARSHRVVPVCSLPLAVEQITALAPLRERMLGVRSIDLVAPSADDPRMLTRAAASNSAIGADDLVREVVGQREFLVRAGGFWQVHRAGPKTLFDAVQTVINELIDAHRFDETAANLDLYGGVGLLAAAVAQTAGSALKVTTVEADTAATDAAAENLADCVGALAVCTRVEHYVTELVRAPRLVRDRLHRATVVLDPPRAGIGAEICHRLNELRPANLVYLACDPVAFARDTRILIRGGYQLVSLRAFDLFPHTHHVETLAVFVR